MNPSCKIRPTRNRSTPPSRRDHDPRERLFEFGHCAVHFAVDDGEVWMCTELKGKASWFLPFNQGYRDGAGNPPNPDGLKMLWTELLAPESLTDIIESYAQIVEAKDRRTGRKKRVQIWPRYHQLGVVRRIHEDIAPRVAADPTFQNARRNTPRMARLAHIQALSKVMQVLLKDDTQVYKQLLENEAFRRFVSDMVYALSTPPENGQAE